MEQTMKQGRGLSRYAWPLIGAIVPIAIILMRRATRDETAENEDEMLLRESKVDLNAALGTALKYMPGTPIEVELEREHGCPVWEVEIVPRSGGPTRGIIIDARNGEVLEMKADFEEEAA
jgi:uncharacterized membrane protein YkoI